MRITLVRHTSVDVPKGMCYGQTDVPLRESFPEEAEIVRSQLGSEQFDAVFTSPLSRCVLLANYCGHTDAIKDCRLMEMNFGDWEMKVWDSIDDPQLNKWYDDWFHTQATNGESSRQQQLRLKEFYDYLKTTDHSNVLIFTHGGIMIHTLLLTNAANLDNVFSLQPSYGGIMRIEL
ncbi:MAG: alpha-ribazole phosphatase [Paramuribaculum sp.]|nr:alpha-ribazole phosphatase [Paramuribaculum sp.]